MNNPFEYRPDEGCTAAFSSLKARIEALKRSDVPEDRMLCRELEGGKMLGVLIAEDCDGRRHTLFAFSGQIGDLGFRHRDFVGGVFDYLASDGYFKQREEEICRQSAAIARLVDGELDEATEDYEHTKERLDADIRSWKEKCRLSKIARDAKRKSGATEEELKELIRQSQYEKAELHRIKKRCEAEIAPAEMRLKEVRHRIEVMREQRRRDSEDLQQWLFTNFTVLNARGESRSLKTIFADTPFGTPPSGAGECCAPKLLQEAYRRGWKPMSMAEYWYGQPKNGEVRIEGEYYPACRGKCLPVLRWMLQGLMVTPPLEDSMTTDVTDEPEVIFENEWFCVVEKPSGILSVPGKGDAESIEDWLLHRYGTDSGVKPAHRLDRDTSGLLVATFGHEALKAMQRLFATREVKKSYIAELDGDYKTLELKKCGRIELPLSPDILDRPRQRVDIEGGKEAITEYEFIDSSDSRSRIIFYPLTGRTHQLRVHAASSKGLGMPIIGDRLYGRSDGKANERLRLHACRIEFTFPFDGRHYCFESRTDIFI